MSGELVVTKEKIASYVHDATEVEKQIFTLEQAVKTLENNSKEEQKQSELLALRAKGTKNIAPQSVVPKHPTLKHHAAQNTMPQKPAKQPLILDFEQFKQSYNYKQKKREAIKESISAIFVVMLGGGLIGLIILSALLEGLSLALENWLNISYEAAGVVTIILFVLLILSIPVIVVSIKMNKLKNQLYSNMEKENQRISKNNAKKEREYQEKLAQYQKELKTYNEENEKYEKALDNKRQELDRTAKELLQKAEEAKQKAEFLSVQAVETRKSLEPLYEQRKTFYSVGIIPPDYRTIDCAYAFDQIFRNDLADTMREAVKIYEERVFRGEIVRGIRSLEQFMSNVSSLLTTLHHDMSAIRSEINYMSQSVSRIYEQQARNHAALAAHNQELLAENRRSYATLERNQELLAENQRDYAALESRNRELFKETQMSRYALEAIKDNNEKLVKYVEDYKIKNS